MEASSVQMRPSKAATVVNKHSLSVSLRSEGLHAAAPPVVAGSRGGGARIEAAACACIAQPVCGLTPRTSLAALSAALCPAATRRRRRPSCPRCPLPPPVRAPSGRRRRTEGTGTPPSRDIWCTCTQTHPHSHPCTSGCRLRECHVVRAHLLPAHRSMEHGEETHAGFACGPRCGPWAPHASADVQFPSPAFAVQGARGNGRIPPGRMNKRGGAGAQARTYPKPPPPNYLPVADDPVVFAHGGRGPPPHYLLHLGGKALRGGRLHTPLGEHTITLHSTAQQGPARQSVRKGGVRCLVQGCGTHMLHRPTPPHGEGWGRLQQRKPTPRGRVPHPHPSSSSLPIHAVPLPSLLPIQRARLYTPA